MWGRNSKKNPQSLVKGVEQLVSLPEVYALAKEKLNDAYADAREIGAIISKDTNLSAQLLRLANSAAYGYSGKVDTVSRAVALVGLRQVESLVLTCVAMETFTRLSPSHINVAKFWRHSMFTAVVSRILARECRVLHAERLFVAGLLHDIGSLILYHHAPELAEKILEAPNPVEEREALGFDHAEVGKALAEQWRLPPALCAAIEYHHEPTRCADFALEVAIVHVANMMSHALELKDDEGLREACDPQAWQLLGISETRINPLFQEALRDFIDVLDLLQPGLRQPDRAP